MNIKFLDSWLRDYLKTDATPKEIAEALTLSSISIERVEKHNKDFLYDAEMMTNRPDLMSVVGIAREAAAVLPQSGHKAEFLPPDINTPSAVKNELLPLTIINNDRLVYRVCAAVMEVTVKPSPDFIKERLETSDIRSLNNLIDITNYVMRTIGHPAHVFDYDRLKEHTIRIREGKTGEQIRTLDGKEYTLPGGDIVAEDGKGSIVDLLGIMGLENSVVTEDTKRIVLFIDNNDPHKMRKTSMSLGIRTEAVQMNEKGVDPELAMDALLFGIELYQQYADGKASEIIDIYPKPYIEKTVQVEHKKIEDVMGIKLPIEEAASILIKLGFGASIQGTLITASVPSYRAGDIDIPEDLIEEIARVYGYHNLPSRLPAVFSPEIVTLEQNPFYWESRTKQALKFWGFTEIYSYPMVSEEMYEGPTQEAVTLQNPLGEEFVFMRRTLVPSLLKVMEDNRQYDRLKLFEIANVYERQGKGLPKETRMIAGLVKGADANFFMTKGIIEQLAQDFGIKKLSWKALSAPGLETQVMIGDNVLGTVEVLDEGLINFELNFELLIKHATLHKSYTPLSKFPPVIEDLSFVIDESLPTGEIIETIKKQSSLIKEVTLLDRYQNSRTFHILYQDPEKNLTNEDVAAVREQIIATLQKKYNARLK